MLAYNPLVSVVIPCYNHGRYLSKAIESVLRQSHPQVEVIVVDDGSTDNTKEVAQGYEGVKYVYKANAGLSAARNTGITHCSGGYVVFLDADDWLYPKAIETNLRYLVQDEKAAFVSGNHYRIFVEENRILEENHEIKSDHYRHFLKYNYIGVPAAVMYCRWVLQEFQFDVTLKACEDYDIYLRIARKYPVLHHTEKIAAYRMHSNSMSTDYKKMLSYVLIVLKRQKDELKTEEEKRALKEGIGFMESFYCYLQYQKIKSYKFLNAIKHFNLFIQYRPRYIVRYFHYKSFMEIKRIFKFETNKPSHDSFTF